MQEVYMEELEINVFSIPEGGSVEDFSHDWKFSTAEKVIANKERVRNEEWYDEWM